MARWPDDWRANAFAIVVIVVLLPLLCTLTWWYVRR